MKNREKQIAPLLHHFGAKLSQAFYLTTNQHFKNDSVNLKVYFFQVPQRISLPASHLLNSLASTVRPSFMTVLDNVQKLFHDVSGGALSEMPLEVLFIMKPFCFTLASSSNFKTGDQTD